ncbi:MAG: NADH-quinone oxidoreductase subunit L [Deltaproteobacteria bacterium]|nr:NADH-quinone oxidoreductase subunit L [Deltaproteobacteria bacterium]
MRTLILVMLLAPLGGAAFSALVGRLVPRRVVAGVACGAVLVALVAAAAALATGGGRVFDFTYWSWIRAGSFHAALDVHYDSLAALMALMVTFVASIIHIYSAGFMREDPGLVRYFAYLNLFVFAMLVIVVADNLAFVYLGWEGVGFCSYALIGFWYTNPVFAAAGRKAFLVTRLGDIAFGVFIALCFVWFGSFSLTKIDAAAPTLSLGAATLLGFLLFWTAAGKSAQLPLSVWLPDAMAGPSPVSALIHAATMVTAGVYLLIRLFPVLQASPPMLMFLAGVGAVTALWAALAALAQDDLKRILAYSTISQVGYMFLAVGAADIVSAMFHLFSHAFFKSLLFLTAGYVIQALEEEHNIYKMGNLHRLLPQVGTQFLIGALALSAFPMVGGYFSKDRILLAALTAPGLAYHLCWAAGFAAALLTPVYTFRAYLIAFGSREEGRVAGDLKPLPRVMVWAMWPLAFLALVDGVLNLPLGPGKNWLARFLAAVPGAKVDLGAPATVAWLLALGSAAGVLAALWLAFRLFRHFSGGPRASAWRETLAQAFYLDHFYTTVVARPYRAAADFLWRRLDEGILDRGFLSLGEGLGGLSQILAQAASGRISLYLLMFLAALAALLGVMTWGWLAL